tara:strand:- start:289 stop:1290 length:1002 start_codon:yes stop_codon:yes gene_type:complete
MAFLDNSGDIILDAVLTDIGRKRMAQGNFRITKFSVGDDEIDYGLYNLTHPSGTAYSDLEILQTPVLEAFTQVNAGINYGLVSYSRQDILYLPEIQWNQKSFNPNIVQKATAYGVVFLADDTKTNNQTPTSEKISSAYTNSTLISGKTNGRFVLLETGISSDELAATPANQSAYLMAVGLMDKSFKVRYDNRFISSILGPDQNTSFTLAGANRSANLTVGLGASTSTQVSRDIKNYTEAMINAGVNRVYAGQDTDTSTQYSAITGPRGAFTALNFTINPNIPQSDYTRFGSTSNDLFGDGNLYDFLDTTVYVQGLSTSVNIQIPIRIIKIVQT